LISNGSSNGRWLIVGAGYVGSALAVQLRHRGSTVVATRRSGGELQVDLDDDGCVALLRSHAHNAIVVHCAPPSNAAAEGHLVAACQGAKMLIYVSSTGVYGRGVGTAAWIDEDAPIAPLSATGQARADAELRLQSQCASAAIPLCILRASGIYGPHRGLIERVRAGTMRIIDDGLSLVCRIHVDDLVQVIIAAGEQIATGIFNASDSEPEATAVVADAVATALALPAPPRIAASTVSSEVKAMLLANRQISNRKMLRTLGIVLRYPSWRTALAEELSYRQGPFRPSL
jgi:nucleoside-diphosphate-sugar epimerase